MRKKLLLLVFLIFVTGCSADYEIEIKDNQVKEKLEYVNTDTSTWDSKVQYGLTYRSLVEASVDYPYPAFDSTIVDENDTIKLKGIEYYNNKLISNNYQLGQRLEYKKFKLDNFNDSSIIKKCYQYFSVIEDGKNIILSTSLKNLCFDEYPLLDDITIKLKTNHKVVSSNADVVKGYHYTWNLTKEDKEDSAILITIKKDEYIFNYENEFVKKIIYIGAFIGIILGVGGISYSILKIKRKNINKI